MSKKSIMIIVFATIFILVVLSVVFFSTLFEEKNHKETDTWSESSEEKIQKSLEENFFISINDNIEVIEYELTDEHRLATLKIPEDDFEDFFTNTFFTVPEEPSEEFFANYKEDGYYQVSSDSKIDILSRNLWNLPTEKIEDVYSAHGVSADGWRVGIVAYITKPELDYRIIYLRGN